MEQPAIAFTGPFGDTNFGDWAMILNNIRALSYQHIVLFSYGPVFNQQLVSEYLPDYDIEIVEVLLDEFDDQAHFPHTPVEILSNVRNLEEIRYYLTQVDKLVVNGGGYFNDEWTEGRMVRLFKILTPMLLADQLEVPIVFTGNSLGPFDLGKFFFTNMFGRIGQMTVAVRDQMYSQLWFEQLATHHEVIFIPDDLLFIQPELSELSPSITVDSDRYILIETYQPIDVIEEELDAYKHFIKYMKAHYDVDVVFLPLNIGDGGTDQGKMLKHYIPDLILIDYTVKGYLPVQDAVNLIKNAELVLTSRYHALVLSMANQTPLLSVMKDEVGDKRYYYNKNGGLIKQIFNHLKVDETRFMKRNFTEAFELIEGEFEEIVTKEKALFETDLYQQNMKDLYQVRMDYLQEYIDKK